MISFACRWLLRFAPLAVVLTAAAADAPGPLEKDFPVARVAALVRPAATQHIMAPANGRFRLTAVTGPVAAGDVLGKFDDAEIRSTLETARLRLRAAQQLEADFTNEAPQRRQEATSRIFELENRLALAEAVAKNPALLRDLPPAMQAQLDHVDAASVRTQLDAARTRLARLDQPSFGETSTARLQVLDAERAVREAESQLREATVVAPIAGMFQATAPPATATEFTPISAGQEIGTLRDLSKLVAAVPAYSPYVVRADLAHSELWLEGPGGKTFRAVYHSAATEPTPVMGETRLFLYEFSAADSHELAALVHTNAEATVVVRLESPVAVVPKLKIALDHPEAFRSGWATGVTQAWPGWVLQCEGESVLGLARAQAP